MRSAIPRSDLMVVVTVLAALFGMSPSIRADNIITYNFNSTNGGEEGWYPETLGTAPEWGWNLLQSSTGGGWQAFTGTNSANSGAVLHSPCMVLDNNKDWVNVVISHRYDFPLSGTTANQAGQIQFRIASGTNDWGNWRGIPSQSFVNTNSGTVPDNYVPSYGPPLFSPLIDSSGTTAVQAWAGTTVDFASGKHETSEFTLFYGDFGLQQGDEIEFRFVMATDQATSGTLALNWEVNKVQIDGVKFCVVPEPGTLALLGIGGGLVVLARLRRTPRGRVLGRSTVMGIVVAAAVAAVALALPSPAQADVLFDFQVNQNGNVPGVTWSGTYQGSVPLSNRWTYYNTGDKRWGVLAAGADGITAAKAAHLTSSTFSGIVDGLPAQNARISLAHNFLLPPSGTGGPRPISLGQLQYQINNSGTWVGLPLDAFTSGGDLNVDDSVFGPSPFKNPLYPTGTTPLYVDQTAFVAPTYVTSTTSPFIPYTAPGGASFVGQSTGWSSLYVPSQAFLNINTGLAPQGITSMQLRLTNANLGGNCNNNEGWNVRMLSVEFDSVQPPVPEPTTLALALAGGGAACAARAFRRRSPAALEAE
ncbi:MAG: PEP-CTERM sorting domain-containing protein [Planctomycetaceae bacterium]